MLSAQVIRTGQPILHFVHIEDITERKRREQELRNSESNYRTLMEQASDAIFISDKDGNYTDANVRATSMFGYSPRGNIASWDERLAASRRNHSHPDQIQRTSVRQKRS